MSRRLLPVARAARLALCGALIGGVPAAQASVATADDPAGCTPPRVDYRLVDAPPGLPSVDRLAPPGATLRQGQRLQIEAAQSAAPADGASAIRLVVRLLDGQGQRLGGPLAVRLETSLGRLVPPADDGQADRAAPVAAAADLLLHDGEAVVWLLAPSMPGEAEIAARSGPVAVQGRITFTAAARPLVAVGLAEAGWSLGRQRQARGSSGDLAQTGFEETLRRWTTGDDEQRLDARVAGFARGSVGPGGLVLTMSMDSDRPSRGPLFREPTSDSYYPVTGDAGSREQQAPTRGPLYLRLDKEGSFAEYGDIQTAPVSPTQRLSAYARSLQGARWHHDGGSARADAFAARGSLRHVVDEQPGRGLSGPYAIGHPDAVVGSEQVEILVRDRVQPALVIRRTRMVRHVDYDFEPFSGRIVFRQPVPSVDEQLNPVSIRIAYEVEGGGAGHWVGGAQGEVDVLEGLTVGASHVEEDDPLAPYRLSGVHGQWRPSPGTVVEAELAHSRGTAFYNRGALADAGDPGTDREGRAGRVEARHDSEALQWRAWAARTGATFQNSASGMAAGREELGLRASAPLAEDWRVFADATASEDRSGTVTDGAARHSASAGLSWQATPGVRLDVSLHRVQEHQVAGAGGALTAGDAIHGGSSTPGLGQGTDPGFGFDGGGLLGSGSVWTAPDAGATAIDRDYTSGRARLTGQVSDALDLFAEHERADRDRQRSAVGAQYRLDADTRAYARHEFANSLTGPTGLVGDGSRTSTTVVGLDTAYMRDGQLFSEYRLAGGASGQDVAAALGVRNLWKLGGGLQASTGVEHQRIDAAAGGAQEAVAVALGMDLLGHPARRIGGKLEWRHSTLQDSTLASLGHDERWGTDWTMLVRGLAMQSRGQGSARGMDAEQQRLQVGAAWRDTQTNRVSALGRLEYRLDDQSGLPLASPGGLGADDATRSRSWVASLHANWRPQRHWTHSAQVAGKTVQERLGGLPATGEAPAMPATTSRWRGALLAGRSTWDIDERWDLSVFGSAQAGHGARLYGLGTEAGYRVVQNLWASVGWVQGQYSDAQLFAGDTTWQGLQLRLRFKFDERLLQQLGWE